MDEQARRAREARAHAGPELWMRRDEVAAVVETIEDDDAETAPYVETSPSTETSPSATTSAPAAAPDEQKSGDARE
jgi:putative membrane protein